MVDSQLVEVILRIGMAMLIGGLVGYERESTHRPAGMRTHMLVSIGAAVVMMLGTSTLQSYSDITTVDPSRLGAQVISGIGFLGAGTIMKEGHSIKGLTTAASLWVVGCLGLAVGSGQYAIASVGVLAAFITLKSFNRVSKHVSNGKYTRFEVSFLCKKQSEVLSRLMHFAEMKKAEINSLKLTEEDDKRIRVEFLLYTNKQCNQVDLSTLLEDLSKAHEINNIQMIAF